MARRQFANARVTLRNDDLIGSPPSAVRACVLPNRSRGQGQGAGNLGKDKGRCEGRAKAVDKALGK